MFRMPLNKNWPEGLEEADIETRKNVIDYYQHWDHEDIREDMIERAHPAIAILENYAYDFNIACSIRNANAFCLKKTYVVGRHKWDRRGACGAHNYIDLEHVDLTADLIPKLKEDGYRIVAIDNIEGAQSIYDYIWQPKSAMIFGQESIGVSQIALDMADDVVYTPQLGSVRSLNVGTASGIFMFHYSIQMNKG